MSKIHSELITKTRLLVSGMMKNVELIKDKGLDAQFLKRLKDDTDQIAEINEECEKLKSEAKAKTKQLNIKINEVRKQLRDSKKIIKRDFEKEQWIKFGISDSR